MNNFFLERIILPMGDFALKSNFLKMLNFWRSFDNLTELELAKYQDKQLKTQLLYAKKHVSRYKRVNIDPSKKASEIIKSFPILTKDDLRSDPLSLQVKSDH